MTKLIKFEALPDEHVEEDETVSGNELFNDIMAGFAELEEFAEGKTAEFSSAQAAEEQGKALRVSEYIDGEHVLPTMLTRQELVARRAARETTSACSAPAATLPPRAGYAAAHRADEEAEPVSEPFTVNASHSI